MVTNIKTDLIRIERLGDTKDYIERKLTIHLTMQPQIDWKETKQAFKRNKTNQHKLAKHIHRQHNTMSVCHRWGTSTSPTCPLCNHTNGDKDHFLRCQHIDMIKIQEKGIHTIQTTLHTNKTEPNLVSTLVYLLRN